MDIVICDDNTEELNEITEYCRGILPDSCKIAPYNISQVMLHDLEEGCVYADIFILDIEMPEVSGIELKNYIVKHNSSADVVFLTSHEELMEEAFGRNVIAFIRKNCWKERLTNILYEKLKENSKMIDIETDKRIISIRRNHIISINAADYYSKVRYIKEGKKEQIEDLLCGKPLKRWEKELGEEGFYRMSRHVILNMEHIRYYSQST